MLQDIYFTGNYFLPNSIHKLTSSSKFKNQIVLTEMTTCEPADVKDFLSYVIARPRLYAGRQWKTAEVFATWLAEGAPIVIRN